MPTRKRSTIPDSVIGYQVSRSKRHPVNREEYCERLTDRCYDRVAPVVKKMGYDPPSRDKVRSSASWAPTGNPSKILGSTTEWDSKTKEIDISLVKTLTDATKASTHGLYAVALHETVHAVIGSKLKHTKPFREACERVGLIVDKKGLTYADTPLLNVFAGWAKELGTYPQLAAQTPPKPKPKTGPKQTLRMECENPDCADEKDKPFGVWMQRRVAMRRGIPSCPCGKELVCTEPDELLPHPNDDKQKGAKKK